MITDPDYICGEATEIKDWTQIKVTVKLENLDTAMAVMSVLDNNLMVEDYSDIDLKTCYGDLIDESILNADKSVASVSLFLPADQNYNMAISFIRERLEAEGVEPQIEIVGVNEEDWANSWKQYYTTLHIGKRTVIVPMWEEYEAKEGEIVVKMDPGMAFGTGSHETTRLVIELLEKYTKQGVRMLDVGTGSGILAICASKLGAGECKAYDIDPIAVKVANENIAESGQTNVTCEVSDLLKQVDLDGGKYDLICANIVADIIIRMTPDIGRFMKDDSVLLCSGIIKERADDVTAKLNEYALKVIERIDDNGWCALAVMKNK
ncbi:MAG: 50S ribosomal protein L11 methyltransferase [Clostridia bacterium]|nr:50S ribosomal protein L11 methyltransferase [Clostridia bacterium]